MPPVATERLQAEVPTRAHAHEAHWDADPRFAATMGGPRTLDQLADTLQRYADEHARNSFAFWIWRERSSGRIVARGGLSRDELDGESVVEVGWAVDPGRWGEGFATELARGCVAYGFDELALPAIWAWTLPENAASRRVMDKLGMRYERDIVHAGLDHVAYRLDAP